MVAHPAARQEADPLALACRVSGCLRRGEPVRCEVGRQGRLHIDRPLPFLCLNVIAGSRELAARAVASANASYLIADDIAQAVPLIAAVGAAMRERFGSFMVLDVGELEHDILLADDSPYLPRFEICVSASGDAAAEAAAKAFVAAITGVEALFRTPHVTRPESPQRDRVRRLREAGLDFPCLSVLYAPIYRQPESGTTYPALRDRLVGNIFDAGLRAFEAFVRETKALPAPPSHRALGRRAVVEAVRRTDRAIDDIASSFDFLLAVTPINARRAFAEFAEAGYERAPRFLYRPLSTDIEHQKRHLYSVSFDHLEDPVLYRLYREKQQELDLQLTMLQAMNGSAFKAFSLALYGPVDETLQADARDILARCPPPAASETVAMADCYAVADEARAMVERYRAAFGDFRARVDIRDDIPAGLMVTGGTLLVSRATVMERRRVEALLSHEIGVHLLTYFNGSAQGLRLFRTGLSGYEGVQEGLAVLAEYLTGGMTRERLRLLAGRVLGCAAMLDGAGFVDTFRFLAESGRFDEATAFGIALRIYRGGGLSKDAIYLRGLQEVIAHLRTGGSLDPFWMGKISASHFPVMQELASRGLLRLPCVQPDFLASRNAKDRLARITAGLAVSDMATL